MLLLVPVLQAQVPSASAELRGRVLDAKTKEPIPNALVRIVKPEHKVLADGQGQFSFRDLRPGTYALEFSAAGYRTQLREGIQLQGGLSTALVVELEVVQPRLDRQVIVTGKVVPTTDGPIAGTRKVGQVEMTRTPASFRDLSRILSAVPGASQSSEKTNDLIVRGGSPWENGFYVDNIPLPNINHFQNQAGVGGAIGVLDVSLIEDVDFYTGGFSVAYGDRMSSIVDIRFREGARDRVRARLNLALAGFSGSVEGPLFKGKASFVLSARRCYYDLITKIIGLGVAPNFGDLHFKLVYDLDARNKITLLNIFGVSTLAYDLETAVKEGFNSSLDYGTGQNTIGLNWLRTWDRGYSNTSLSYSTFKNSATIVAVNPDTAGSKYSATEEGKGEIVLRNVNIVQAGPRSKLEFGIEAKSERFNFDNYLSSYINHWDTEIAPLLARGTFRAWKSGLFAAWIYSPAKALAVSLGARADHFSLTRAWHLAPRVSVSLKLNDRLAINAAWGIYDQGLPLFLTAENPENRKKRDPFATHAIAGLKLDLKDGTQIVLEAYEKKYRNTPLTPDDPTNFLLDSGVDFGFYRTYSILYDNGIARARGIEFLIQKKTMDKLYGVLSAGLSRTEFRDESGIWRPRIIDRQYLITAIGGFAPNERWAFSGRWRLAGGRPYTPYDIRRSSELNRGIFERTQVLARRFPPFMSLSLQANRQFRFKRSALNVYVSVMNASNRKNVERYFWDRIHNRPGTVYQAPLVPEFGIEYVF
jgi:hypothetical protein